MWWKNMKISMMIGLLLLLIGGGVAYSWCGMWLRDCKAVGGGASP